MYVAWTSIGASVLGNRNYTSYYLASKYVVTLDEMAVVTCWGAFTQVQCNRAADEPAAAT